MEGLSTFYFSILIFAVVSFIWFVSFCHCVLCLHKQKSLCNWTAKLEKECPAMLFMLIWLLLFLSLLSNMIWEVCKLGKDGARVCLPIWWRYQGIDLHSNEPGKIKKGEFYLWAPPEAVCLGPHMILAPGKVMRSGTETREGRKTGAVAHGFAWGS